MRAFRGRLACPSFQHMRKVRAKNARRLASSAIRGNVLAKWCSSRCSSRTVAMAARRSFCRCPPQCLANSQTSLGLDLTKSPTCRIACHRGSDCPRREGTPGSRRSARRIASSTPLLKHPPEVPRPFTDFPPLLLNPGPPVAPGGARDPTAAYLSPAAGSILADSAAAAQLAGGPTAHVAVLDRALPPRRRADVAATGSVLPCHKIHRRPLLRRPVIAQLATGGRWVRRTAIHERLPSRQPDIDTPRA